MTKKPLVVAVGGTLRPNSSTERVLAAVLAETEARGAQTRLFSGEAINFPMYQPGATPADDAVTDFSTRCGARTRSSSARPAITAASQVW